MTPLAYRIVKDITRPMKRRRMTRRVHGVWTLISDYWSGDGSLGIKQSRYKLVPAEQEQ